MKLKLFALNASHSFGEEVAKHLNEPLCEHDEYRFDDGECYVAPKPQMKENVRGCDVFVIQSCYGSPEESVNDKIIKLLIFLGALRDASAGRVTAVVPYFPYCRQDRKTSSRAPITTKYMARLFKALWTDRVLSMDVHNPTAIQNAYHIPADLLEANNLMALYTTKEILQGAAPDDLVVMSPDSGGLGRARKYRSVLSKILSRDIGIACLDKIHEGRSITGNDIMGDVSGKRVIIYDDMISSGKTIKECIDVCRNKGARSVLAVCAPHGLFVGDANKHLDWGFLENIVITDTVTPFRLTNPSVRSKLHVIDTSSLFAEAISRIHDNTSVSDLIQNHLSELKYSRRAI